MSKKEKFNMGLVLYQFHISPYCGKIRAILRYKGIDCELRMVHPIDRRELIKVSRQRRVPVLVDGAKVVIDSTDIAAYLEERFPDPPIYPRGRRDRAQALLWEDWADEAPQRVVGPLKFLHVANARRMAVLEGAQHPTGNVARIMRLAQPVVALEMRTFGQTGSLKRIIHRFEDQMQLLADRLEDLFLVGDRPTIADFAVFGVLEPLEDLYGWNRVEEHENLARWYDRMKTLPPRPIGHHTSVH